MVVGLRSVCVNSWTISSVCLDPDGISSEGALPALNHWCRLELSSVFCLLRKSSNSENPSFRSIK